MSLKRLGPLKPVVILGIVCLTFLTVSRLVLALVWSERVLDAGTPWKLFVGGLRLDLLTTGYVIVFPTIASAFLPQRMSRWVTTIIGCAFAVLIIGMEVLTHPYVAEYDVRPGRLFIDYLGGSEEIFATLRQSHMAWMIGIVVLVVLGVAVLGTLLLRSSKPVGRWGFFHRVFSLPIALVLIFLCVRGSLGHRPVNAAAVAYSTDHLVNELALNSVYSAGFAAYNQRYESNPQRLYGPMELEEAASRVDGYRGRVRTASATGAQNLVMVVEESMGAEWTGCLGESGLTPELDALCADGTLFTNLYSTGTRTVRGLEALLSGFLPTPGRSVVKLEKSQNDFYTIAEDLGSKGYTTLFIYGGDSHFDNMRRFLLGNGFDRVYDRGDYPDPEFEGAWGVSDEDLMALADQVFQEQGDKPFFAVILSATNHAPFEYPEGRIEPQEPAACVENAIRYADYAIGELFRAAKQSDYYDRTQWCIVADHNTRVFGADVVPIARFHIPALIIGPDIPQGEKIDELCSQIDLPTTLLPLIGHEVPELMVGRDLLVPDANRVGRAILQYHDSHAFWVGDEVVVHKPGAAAKTFTYASGTLEPTEVDPELIRDALAHAVLPWVLYSGQLYRLGALAGL